MLDEVTKNGEAELNMSERVRRRAALRIRASSFSRSSVITFSIGGSQAYSFITCSRVCKKMQDGAFASNYLDTIQNLVDHFRTLILVPHLLHLHKNNQIFESFFRFTNNRKETNLALSYKHRDKEVDREKHNHQSYPTQHRDSNLVPKE